MKTFALGIVIFPSSWRLGLWRREKKDIFSVGPIRFVLYKKPGEWKRRAFECWEFTDGLTGTATGGARLYSPDGLAVTIPNERKAKSLCLEINRRLGV
jgi:hypothetical protein